MGPNSVARIAWRVASRNTNSPPLEPATGFELLNVQREWSCVNSAGTADPRAALFEHDLEAATPIPLIKKPFDILTEGLLSEKSRGDWTPLELFLAGVQGWEARLGRRLNDAMPGRH
jgi:hypothetical protein